MYIFYKKHLCKEEENEPSYKLHVCKDHLCINCLNEIVLVHQLNIYFVMSIILEKNLKKGVILFIYVYIYLSPLICILLIVVHGNTKSFEMTKKKKKKEWIYVCQGLTVCVIQYVVNIYCACFWTFP